MGCYLSATPLLNESDRNSHVAIAVLLGAIVPNDSIAIALHQPANHRALNGSPISLFPIPSSLFPLPYPLSPLPCPLSPVPNPLTPIPYPLNFPQLQPLIFPQQT